MGAVFLDKRNWWVESVPTATGFRYLRLGRITGMTRDQALDAAQAKRYVDQA